MRFVSYNTPTGPSWGILVGESVVEQQNLGANAPASLQELFDSTDNRETLLADLASQAANSPTVAVDQLSLLPCVPKPGKVICLGVNYIDHANEGGNTIGDYPAVFLRCSSSLLAHKAPLQVPKISDKLDYEAELAVVIGSRARFVSESEALNCVFGYACFNDATLRDYQRKTAQWTVGKNFDNTGGFGPCLVTTDELPEGCVGLRIQSRLNGTVMQDADTANMAFGVARTIALLSEAMTLEPGDVILMGTPGGVGYARTPSVWMKAGDTIEVEIEGIGTLINEVCA
ncbi:fumarylacetoacetate hydrolase family protein [Granulosicoccus antarcticus]|uniref:Ureidoglycolate lyase n=1 Tax=Granulosicoccus antarcticus IMCC3135 TaxID=1192854 RepID=A0A2Z2NP65_9GAMM|nr:fumarylacetoacetate hydrolase family protein [Granulosicoccus antarcticus]ASJ73272.1 Ureidoglycolate lyase [Granulosicoccus antarcticus IMCC3135]